MQKAGDRNVR